MQSIKFLNLYIGYMVVSTFDMVSTKRQRSICIPCVALEGLGICGSDEKDKCITDSKQLLYVLKKTANEVIRQAQENFEDKLKEHIFVEVIVVIAGALIILTTITVSVRTIVKKIRAGICVCLMQRNKAQHLNETSTLLVKDETKCGVTEFSTRRSLFKKCIDATLSRTNLEKMKECMKSVGILFWNRSGQGTVVRTGSKYIITAWHVIEPIVSPPGNVDRNGRAVNSVNLKALSNTGAIYVDFNENTSLGGPHCRFGLLPKICFLDKSLDTCILELDGQVRNLPKPIAVYRNFEEMNKGTTTKFVHVIGQHPDTPDIVVDPGCKIILHDDEKVKEANKWIKKHERELLRHGDMDRNPRQCYDVFGSKQNLIFDTYLEFGASGAAVITITPAGEVALVGILMRGLPHWFWTKSGNERGFKPILRMEVACPITEILSSKEWIESEKDKIFGQFFLAGGAGDTGAQMETDQNERGATGHDQHSKDDDMETEQLERDTADNRFSGLSLRETC